MPWSADGANAGFGDGQPWLPVPDEHRLLAVDRQSDDPQSVLNAFRRFLAWRREQRALVVGDLVFVQSPPPVFAFERRLDGRRVLCAFNLSNGPASLSVRGAWRPLDGHGFQAELLNAEVALPPFGVFFGEAVA